ncbi:MAG: hypothetical protein U0K60_12035, partial [Parafannyhessea umbonata]|nr:hypothetical protein [Parafannyhessea umbonata]
MELRATAQVRCCRGLERAASDGSPVYYYRFSAERMLRLLQSFANSQKWLFEMSQTAKYGRFRNRKQPNLAVCDKI